MFHYRFLDLRHSPTLRVFEVLSEGLRQVQSDLYQAEESGEGYLYEDTALEYADSLYGIAFVTAQTYIEGTVSDARIATGFKWDKGELLKNYSTLMPGAAITQLQLCDAIANYFKHRDAWANWDNKTAATLLEAGIAEKESYPCVAAAQKLRLHDDSDLTPLLRLLSAWRQAVIGACETAPDPGPQADSLRPP